MNLPNTLTILRILSVPVLVVLILMPSKGNILAAFILFLLATLTDTLDGFWARRKKQVTVIGELLDPIADKLLVISVLVCLVETGGVPAWMAVIIIGREVAVTGFRAIASSRGVHIPASPLGKTKMLLEVITLALLILGRPHLKGLIVLARAGLWLVILTAVLSAAEYYWKYTPRILSGRA